MTWNFADLWEAIAEAIPDAPAQRQGTRLVTWGEMDARADGVARAMLEAGVGEQGKVAQYLFNCPEYLESVFAAYKAGLVPVNTNYRYGGDELVYLWDNADAEAVVFHGAFTETIDEIRKALPGVRAWLWVDDGTGPRPDWALDYAEAAAAGPGRTLAPWGRSPEQLMLLYTGGTTGRPKGVMWRQGDLFEAYNASSARPFDPERGLASVAEVITGPGPVHLPASPLMHATGAFTSFMAMDQGGCIVTLEQRRFDVDELLHTVERERVNTMAIVGDAFAKPIVARLEEKPDRWDLSSLRGITSSGVMWSQATKRALLEHNPDMVLMDGFSSSEALGMGASVATKDNIDDTARFQLSENARVIDDAGRDVEPGSGQIGRLAVTGLQPIGYYKDEAKTAETFVELDGKIYSVPGDYATVEADGTLTLLGRGSVCINTGGEKVYPEEVEEALKTHPAVRDAVVVGVPDERFGETVTAVIEPEGEVDEGEVVAHVRARLAAYKAPRRLLTVTSIARSPSGKVDYRRLRTAAERESVPVASTGG